MAPRTIEILRVAGSHREVGRQIGDAFAPAIRRASRMDPDTNPIPAGRTLEQQLALAGRYRIVAERAYPWLLEEFDGCAEAAGVDPLTFFAVSIEEIWYDPEDRRPIGRCSDLVAGPEATTDGHLLVGHNNDLGPDAEDEIVAIEKTVPGDPVIFQLGGAPWLSVGFNSAGLALTGNELSPNDERIGVSRSLQVFEIMRCRSVDEALRASLRPDRASSYNNVLTHRDGAVADVEGSATDAEVTGLGDDGTLAHTNNYVCERMVAYEGDPQYARGSQVRYDRARGLLGRHRGSIDPSTMRTMLSDHQSDPSLCRHADSTDRASKTVFWVVADITTQQIAFGRGNPCDSQEQTYTFTTHTSSEESALIA
ncbi:MAG: C45 family peptidase [Actinomycetota bacterium]